MTSRQLTHHAKKAAEKWQRFAKIIASSALPRDDPVRTEAHTVRSHELPSQHDQRHTEG